MNIAHVNYSDARDGVSGSVRCLMDAQKMQGDNPVLFTPQRQTGDDDVFLIEHPQGAWEKSLLAFERKEGINGLKAGAMLDLWRHPQFVDADVVHLHGTTAAYFSYGLLPSLASKPLVWSIYDSHPYTAGCSHTSMCQGWQARNCRNCPLLPQESQGRSEELFMLKKSIYGIIPLAAVTANSWLTGQVKAGILSERFAAEIPPAVDPVFFRRANAPAVRQQLGIPQDSFVLGCAAPGGLAQPMHSGPFIRQLLEHWREGNQQVVLLQLGGGQNDASLPSPFTNRIVPQDLPPDQRSAALQAVDVFLQLTPHDAVGMNLLEAAAAGIPAVAFPAAAGLQIRHLETGYLTSSNSKDELLRAVQFLRRKPGFAKKMGQTAAQQAGQRHQPAKVADAYRPIYEKMIQGAGRIWPKAVGEKVLPTLPVEGGGIQELWDKVGMRQRAEQALKQGTEGLWTELESCCNGYSPERQAERGAFIDLYLSFVLSGAKQPLSPALLNDVIDQWTRRRQLPQRCGNFSPLEKQALQAWTKILRQTLTHFFLATPEEYFVHLSIFQQGRFIDLWRILFFNDFTTPYLEEEEHLESRRQAEATTSSKSMYPDLLIRSMYTPYPPEAVKLDMGKLLKKGMPIAMQVILAFWIVNVPYYEGDAKRQRIMRRNAKAFLQSALQDPEAVPQNIFVAVTTHFVSQFWRTAYLGGNLVEELSLLGDFLHQQMRRFHPQFMDPIAAKPHEEGRRLRIGYISSNFCHQAVSYYMANRIFFANKQRFEIQIFSLEKRHDTMTDHIKAYSDRYVAFSSSDAQNLAHIAETIKQSELDLLIYADIGMEHIGYQLGAMRLAPVQCVLVGHGATTGLPTMDYYLSGDFEAPEAQEHYREKLVRLPNLGAAQLPPASPPTGRLQRKDFGFPEDKVLLVSCANGIKHGPDRDAALVRILQLAPQAVIALKPFMTPDLVQPQWSRRIMEAARRGGVEDRLRIIPPLAQGRDLMDFLAMADIQLDTYPYGGWTTNMEAVYAGLAIVTQEGDQARSRWGAHILRALGITAGIAKTEAEYVRQAVELVNNNELREQTRRQIKAKAVETLFNGAAAQPAYEAELLRIYKQSMDRNPQVVQK